ncbi:bifunctional DNA-formamidopyrimidine glycosylase/DNA-(apurinic or apyrimidinic site) lyase [Arthrobacter sp. KK5.5]|uniref:bifunctional DNA-formamidopyrimidine glycosylase/DNA-(apurinic or apyrimidinic site) lyase n=1 Tax=Arthrobacter sp. KK5.5 TaxID=3373084 RepID=UPI003EE42F2F
MPELPEAEVVRRGLESWVAGRTIVAVHVHDPRSVRRHAAGPEHFAANLSGATVTHAVRRGKFLWMPLEGPSTPTALVAHLGMSGQLLVEDPEASREKHLKVRVELSAVPGMPGELRFVDQRIFGGLHLSELRPTPDGGPGGHGDPTPLIPASALHIARDVLDPAYGPGEFHARLRRRRTQIKRAILDQGLVSGVGNIYADEALWASRLHYGRSTTGMRPTDSARLLEALRTVMTSALRVGGTSFDSLYVNVNGASGYFDRSLNAYGREGLACPRCLEAGRDTLIRREPFMGRSSFGCPVCQRMPRPRTARPAATAAG